MVSYRALAREIDRRTLRADDVSVLVDARGWTPLAVGSANALSPEQVAALRPDLERVAAARRRRHQKARRIAATSSPR